MICRGDPVDVIYMRLGVQSPLKMNRVRFWKVWSQVASFTHLSCFSLCGTASMVFAAVPFDVRLFVFLQNTYRYRYIHAESYIIDIYTCIIFTFIIIYIYMTAPGLNIPLPSPPPLSSGGAIFGLGSQEEPAAMTQDAVDVRLWNKIAETWSLHDPWKKGS